MDVTSTSPLRVASILWRPALDAWALTVVCKATYRLEPNVCPLHDEQDPPNEEDTHWDDDPSRSLASCTDLAPFKSRADVLLVGHAYAPDGRPLQSLIARLVVGNIDKAIEVLARRTDVFAPIGFGPLAPTWPTRAGLLGGHCEMFTRGGWRDKPLPKDVDSGYFNAAPLDQQVETLRSDERIKLENLHPTHSRLVTRLPGTTPSAFVERPGIAAKELGFRADTLIIDTDRRIVALVWRANVPLTRPDEAGRVVVTIETQRPKLSEADVANTVTMNGEVLAKSPLPFTTSERARGEEAPGTPASRRLEIPPLPIYPPPMMSPLLAPDPPRAPPSPIANAPIQNPRAAAGKRIGKMGAWRGSGATDASPLKGALPGSAFAASNAAANGDASNGIECAVVMASADIPARGITAEPVELIWFDTKLGSRIRRKPEWKKILADLKNAKAKARDDESDDDSRENRQEAKDRRDVLAILRRGEAVDAIGLDAALSEAMEEDAPAPLVMVAGDIEFSFDEMETLKAMLAVVAPFVPGDKRLKETVDLVAEVLKAPGIEKARGVAEAMITRIRDAFGPMARGVSAGYLEAQTEPMLLEGRSYQKRAVMGVEWLRAHLRVPGSQAEQAIPVYLPESLKNELPMFRRFRARVIAEVRDPVDQYETAEVAMKVVGIEEGEEKEWAGMIGPQRIR